MMNTENALQGRQLRGVVRANVAELADRWWAMALRGAAAIAFGIICFAAPALGFLALVMLFGAYALLDGAFNLVLAVRRRQAGGHRWGWILFEGIAGILAGVIALIWPAFTGLMLVLLIGAWALVRGVSEIATAIRLRREVKGEWLMALMGALSLGLGVGFLMFPVTGAVALVLWIGAYTLVFGLLLVFLAFRLRSFAHHRDHTLPTGGVPTPA